MRRLLGAVAGTTATALLIAGCSSGGDDQAACQSLSATGVMTTDYDELFEDHRNLSNDLRSALKALQDQPSAPDRAGRVAGLCARHGVTIQI